MNQYSPAIQRDSIDEAFLEFKPLYGRTDIEAATLEAAHQLRQQIKKELGFTVNIGIGPNKLLAKMAFPFGCFDRKRQAKKKKTGVFF